MHFQCLNYLLKKNYATAKEVKKSHQWLLSGEFQGGTGDSISACPDRRRLSKAHPITFRADHYPWGARTKILILTDLTGDLWETVWVHSSNQLWEQRSSPLRSRVHHFNNKLQSHQTRSSFFNHLKCLLLDAHGCKRRILIPPNSLTLNAPLLTCVGQGFPKLLLCQYFIGDCDHVILHHS